MFSDSGTQQLSIPDSTGIFLLKPHFQCHKNKGGSVIPCAPGGKIGWLCCHTVMHKGKMHMALATFVNSPSVVWMLKNSWLQVLFHQLVPLWEDCQKEKTPSQNAWPEKQPTGAVWQRECSVVCAHSVFSKWKCCLLPRTHSTDTSTTFFAFFCLFFCLFLPFSAYPLHPLNFKNMTLSLTFLFKWFLSSLMSGPAPAVQLFPCGTDSAQGRAGRGQLSQDWTLHCPGANTLSWEANCQRHPPTALCQNPDVQNHEITICRAGNEFHKPSCENLLKFHNTYISRKTANRG